MSKENSLRTYPIKSLCIFLGIAFVVSLAMVILMVFLHDELWVIRIAVWIVCGLFVLASATVLIQQLFFYVEVNDDYFIKHFVFGKHEIAYKKIEKIVNRDGFYDIYVAGRKISSFAANTKESQQIIVFLEKKGLKIEW